MECQGDAAPQTGHHSWVYPDGSRYEGDWQDGQRHGRGVLHYKCGDIYDGEWRKDKANGHGRFMEANGEVYVGDWVDDKRHGKGEHYDANGQLEYDGEWENDVYHGFGTLFYESGDKYVGQWREEMREGSGTLYYHSGDCYDGSWLQDKANGMGRFTEASGKVYVGGWKDDKRHGVGTCFYNDGKKEYDGQWRADCYHGQGTIWYNTGDRYQGGWKNDERHGFGVFWYACGNRYEGEWRNDLCHGRGALFYASGDKYDGDWKFGRANGRGIFIGSDGEVYRGDWKDDQRHGCGALHSPDGTVTYLGQWIDDEQVPNSFAAEYPLSLEEMEELMVSNYDEEPEDEDDEEGTADDDDVEDALPRQTVLRRFRDNRGSVTAPVARPSSSLLHALVPRIARGALPMDDGGLHTAPPPLPTADDNIFEDEEDDMEELRMMDICTWLRRLNLEKYTLNFVEQEISDVSILRELTDDDLQKMGIISIGARKKIMAAITQEKERQNCVICMEEPRCMVVDPCGHLAMCSGCAKRVRHCPMCRSPVNKVIVVYDA